MSKYLIPVSVLALALSQTAEARAQSANNLKQMTLAAFEGTDRNWFNPANWSTGRIPDENTVVVLDGGDDVVIDPSQASAACGCGAGKVSVHDISITKAHLETLPGTTLTTNAVLVEDQGQFVTRSTVLEASLVYVSERGYTTVNPGVWYLRNGNSAGASANTYQGATHVNEGTLSIGLGGREAAGLQKVGAGVLHLGYGYYANTQGGNVVLGNRIGTDAGGMARAMARVEQIRHIVAKQTGTGSHMRPIKSSVDTDVSARLSLALYYDFKPAPGDAFQIITADTLVGEFQDLPEGALVGCTEDDTVGLWITYRGGDGNDVVLNANRGTPEVCATREHILLARQVGVPH